MKLTLTENFKQVVHNFNMKNQENGNTQLNQARNEYNERVILKKYLGSTPRVYWNQSRRFRTI